MKIRLGKMSNLARVLHKALGCLLYSLSLFSQSQWGCVGSDAVRVTAVLQPTALRGEACAPD